MNFSQTNQTRTVRRLAKGWITRFLLALTFAVIPLSVFAQTPMLTAENPFRQPVYHGQPLSNTLRFESQNNGSPIFDPNERSVCQPLSPHLVCPEKPSRTAAWYKETFCGRMTTRTLREALEDQKNLYRRENLLPFALVFGGSAVLANTSMDQNFANWYQRRVRTSSTDSVAGVAKVFGDGFYFIPAGVGISLLHCIDREWHPEKPKSVIGEFGYRTTRGYLVGAIPLTVGQSFLGGTRPRDARYHSSWQPFEDDNGVSGHAFIGAVPFITAAQMTDRPLLKGLFYTVSVLPAWSRVNDDQHYLSQVILGWYIAYLSVSSVTQTEINQYVPKGMTLFPVLENNGAIGVGLHYSR